MLYNKINLRGKNLEKIGHNYAIAKVNDYQIDSENFNQFISNKEGLESFTNNYMKELVKNKDDKRVNEFLEKSSNLVDYVNKLINVNGKVDQYKFGKFYESSKDKLSKEIKYSNPIKKYSRIALGLGNKKNKLEAISNNKDTLELILNSAISGDKINSSFPLIKNDYQKDIKTLANFARKNGFYNISMEAYEYLNDLSGAKKIVETSVYDYINKNKSENSKDIAFNLIDKYYDLSKNNNLEKESFDFFEYTSDLGDEGMKKLDSILGEMFNDSNIKNKQKVKAIHKFAEICYSNDKIDTSKYASKADNWLMTAKNLLESKSDSENYFSKIKEKLDVF